MQEESGELACSERNGVLVWSCPLCQQGQTDRDALALHLTRGHSVLPACLDRLLETAVPVDCTGEDNVEDKAENDIDARSPQQKHLEISKTPSDPSEADMNTEGPSQAAALEPNESWVKPASCHEKEVEGEESGDPEETEGSLEPNLERTELSDSKESEKGSSNAAADKDGPDAKSSATVSGDPSLERFLDPNCPFKCHTCLESFTSKSALSLHYCSPNHLQRIRTVWEKQGGGNNSCTSIQPNAIRPFRSSKPYQCAVCRVSYNHAITLESHLKSVLHQTRSRNSALYQNRTRKCSSGAPGNSGSKGAGNGVTATSSAVSSGGDTTPTTSASTGNCSNAASLAAPATMTKEEEQMKAHPVLSLLSSPVASAQAVSAFLTLLTSSSPSLSPSLLPSLYTVSAGAAPGTPAPQLMPQQQLMPLMPLFLNGLQAPSPNAEPGSPILTQPVSVLGLNAAQQALLAQRLGCLQSLGLAVGNPAAVQASAEEQETRDAGEEEEMVEESHSPLQGGKTEEEEDRCGKGSMSEEFEHGEQAGSNMSVDEEAEGKTVSEELCGETIQPDLNSPIASNKVPDDSPSPGNVSLPSNTSLSPIHLNLTLSPDTTPQKSHTDASQSPSSNPSPNHSSRHSPSSAGAEHKPNFARPGRLNAIPALNPQAAACSNANVKPPNPNPKPRPGPPAMSEFQHQVLWAFLESRSEADAASPPQEDCEALSLEVGLEVEEVRRWFSDAWEARERAKLGTEHAGCKASRKNPDAEDPERATDEEPEEGDGVLTIVESEGGDSPARHSGAMDLSSSRGRGKEQESEDRGGDSDKEEFYTSVIVTDEESRDSSAREEPVSPMRVDRREPPAHKKDNCGGKVLRSSTVFLSDAEDDEDDEEGGTQRMKRKRKMEMENEEADIKRRRQDPDVDLELEAQADPPAPLSISLEQQGLPRISGSNILHSLPLSLSLAPFATQFISPYVLQLPASAVGLGINALEENRGKVPSFTNPPAITRYSGPFSDPLNAPPPASHTPPSRFLPNGGEYESALDLSIGKNHSATTSSSTSASIKEAIAQRDRLLDGLGFKPTTVGVPGAGGLIVVRVKPEHALAIPSTTNSSTVNISSNPKTNTFFVRKAEQISKTLTDRARIRDQEREREREKDNKSPKPQPFKDMRRSRTIIHTEQLDVLYGCYFKDPNPGKHEFEQIADWVHLPKKVVQIWFQNMRARERKGEVRFISDGTLAAVGKPLIKFTWPLTSPIFSSRPKSSPSGGGGVTKLSAASSPTLVHPKTKPEMEQLKEKDKAAPFVPKPKLETQTPTTVKVKLLPKVKAATAAVPEGVLETQPPLPYSSLKCKREKEEQKQQDEEEVTDEEEEEHVMDKIRPGATNRMTPKQSASTSKPNASGSQKHNGLNYWSPKGPFKINTLTREQLGLSAARTPVVSPPAPVPAPAPAAGASAPRPIAVKPSQADGGFVHHTTPRRPRTHLSSLQLSILQSCYETCAHPNALECETLGTELGLPLKVVQIWFQNTRAKEKRWRLQQEKQFPGATDSKKVEFRAGSYLQYSALRANRPILPKPVHLTEVDPATPPVPGQPAGNETLRGRCEVCGVAFESRSAGRAHVFSPRHLATLRATNFGQPPSLVTGGSAAGSGSGSGSGASPLSPSSSLPISTS